MKKRTFALILALVLVFGAAVGGTIAYLTDKTDEVKNTFTVGKVDIDLDEAKVTQMGEKDGDTRVKANTYKLIPGHTYVKDPTITVADDSEDCYLFVKIDNQLGDAATLNMNTKWTAVSGKTGVYQYADKVSAKDTAVVFDKFTFSKDITAEQLPSYEGKTIIITACAVQADGLTLAEAANQATFG